MDIVDNINKLYVALLIFGTIYFLQKGHKKRQEAQVLKFRQHHREAWLRKNRPNKLNKPEKIKNET